MTLTRIAIATSTLYTDLTSVRVALAKQFFTKARQHEITVFCVGQSPLEIRELLFTPEDPYIKCLPGYPGSTFGQDRRQALQAACNYIGESGIWIWTEPEKVGLPATLPDLINTIITEQADILIPTRSSTAWQSLPDFQWMGEQCINAIWHMLTNIELDLAAGPRLGTAKMAPYFLTYTSHHGDSWDSLNCPLLNIVQADRKVISAPWTFEYPPEQMAAETADENIKIKRLKQFKNISESLLAHSRAIQFNP